MAALDSMSLRLLYLIGSMNKLLDGRLMIDNRPTINIPYSILPIAVFGESCGEKLPSVGDEG